jgi:hypothetical protein
VDLFFEPNNKLNDSDRSVVARRSKSYVRSIFDSDGIVARVAVPVRGIVTENFTVTIFSLLKLSTTLQRTYKVRNAQYQILHDNAPTYRSALVQA